MADKRQHRKQKKREKDKVKSEHRKRARATRKQQQARLRNTTLQEAAGWDLADAYVSEDWHAQGPRVWAVFARQHSSGSMAAAIFDVDLRERGVVSAELRVGIPEGELHMELARLSQTKAMMIVEAGLVVKVVKEGLAHGESRGVAQPEEAAEAMTLFAGVEPSYQDVLVGAEPPPPPEPEGGLFSSIKRKLGLG
ncbi:MAG: hypothetical protein H6739_10340 [Alphaproteobacteria bacterium]|nr:hypothetical protein [Alphaproteobacteria bacterium]